MQKYFSIMLLLNGIVQHNETTKNTFYYSLGEAEFHMDNWFKNGDNNMYIVVPFYRKGERDDFYNETRKRISEKYPDL